MAGFQLKLPLTWESFPPPKKKVNICGEFQYFYSNLAGIPQTVANGQTPAVWVLWPQSKWMCWAENLISTYQWLFGAPASHWCTDDLSPAYQQPGNEKKYDDQLFIISWSCLTVPFTQPGLWWHRPANTTNHCNYVTRELPLTSPTTKPPKPSYWIESLASADIGQLVRKLFFFRLQLRKGSVGISTSTSTW